MYFWDEYYQKQADWSQRKSVNFLALLESNVKSPNKVLTIFFALKATICMSRCHPSGTLIKKDKILAPFFFLKQPLMLRKVAHGWDLWRSYLEVGLHLPPDDVGVVDHDHLFAGLDCLQGPILARPMSILKLVRVESVLSCQWGSSWLKLH